MGSTHNQIIIQNKMATAVASPTASQPVMAARSGRLAPIFCPANTAAGVQSCQVAELVVSGREMLPGKGHDDSLPDKIGKGFFGIDIEAGMQFNRPRDMDRVGSFQGNVNHGVQKVPERFLPSLGNHFNREAPSTPLKSTSQHRRETALCKDGTRYPFIGVKVSPEDCMIFLFAGKCLNSDHVSAYML
jgi:hypothetical protein